MLPCWLHPKAWAFMWALLRSHISIFFYFLECIAFCLKTRTWNLGLLNFRNWHMQFVIVIMAKPSRKLPKPGSTRKQWRITWSCSPSTSGSSRRTLLPPKTVTPGWRRSCSAMRSLGTPWRGMRGRHTRSSRRSRPALIAYLTTSFV